MSLNILVIGGSRHIGYHSALRFLDAGSTVTFLLRSPTTFDDDEVIQKHVKSGKARLVQGDGLVVADVQNVWAVACRDKPVDVLLFTVGFSDWKPKIPSDERFCHLSSQPCLPMSPQRSLRNAKNRPSSESYHLVYLRC